MNYIVRIPEPCHEDWNQMKPDEKGRYCNVCSKSVHDFSDKTDAYIHSVLRESREKNVQVCGHFRKSQLDRPLLIKIPFTQLAGNVSRLNVFAVALFFVFGTFLFSCSDNNGRTVGEIGLTEMPDTKEKAMMQQWTQGEPSATDPDTLVEECTSTLGESIITETMVNGGVGYDRLIIEEPLIEGKIVEEPMPPLLPDTIIENKVGPMIAGGISYNYIELPKVEPVPEMVDSSIAEKQTGHTIPPLKENKLQVYPNPGTGEFNIAYEVKQRGTVQADVYDLNGNLIRSIIKPHTQHTGRYVVPVNLGDLASGIYMCKVIINGTEQHEEVVIVK
jgi:hypothetical protein